ncbi:hypothetical protein [Sphingomonas bacterium]|uniref:hypothetical protein n=1 Tax=Sphingomonas bacterium TaxID=1895847 RepID=UPI0015759532|nr:hypothetical protein [Sphingomonas bacterium]
MPPADWTGLPALRYDTRPETVAGLDEFVRGEVAAGRCAVPRGVRSLRIDLALLVAAAKVVRVVPRAIDCATVEQFAAGFMTRIARDRLDPTSPDGWYRATLDAAWRD